MSDALSLLDGLAARLQRSVTLTDPQLRHLAGSAHYGDEDMPRVRAILQRAPMPEVFAHIVGCGVLAWTVPGRVPAVPSLEFRARVVVPLRVAGALLGFLMIIDADDSLTAGELDAVSAVAAEVARHVHQERRAVHVENLWTERVLLDLVGDEPARRLAAQEAMVERHGIAEDARAVVAVVVVVAAPAASGPGHQVLALREGVARGCRRSLARSFFYARTTGAGVFQIIDHRLAEADLPDRAATMAGIVAESLGPGARCVVGLESAPAPLAELWRSHEHARLAARVAALQTSRGDVVDWSDLGVLSFLLDLPLETLENSVPRPLRILLEEDANGVLGATLRAYLDHAGSIPEAAAALHLHRSSLYYRLHQIERLTGLDLGDGEHRLMLHLGLRMLDVISARS